MGNCFGKKKSDENKDDAKPTEPEPQEKNKPDKATPEVTDEPKTDSSFAQELLDTQNTYRAKHGVPAMTLNQQLCDDAQKWADRLAAKDQLEHSNETDAGENLAWGSGELTGEATAKMWYDEINNYDFKNPGYSGNTGHFTQVVWKASTEFGAGTAKTGSGTYVVGRFLPAGNITNAGQFEENVLPLV